MSTPTPKSSNLEVMESEGLPEAAPLSEEEARQALDNALQRRINDASVKIDAILTETGLSLAIRPQINIDPNDGTMRYVGNVMLVPVPTPQR